jgi:type II secretory pathway pseudopilin PulG
MHTFFSGPIDERRRAAGDRPARAFLDARTSVRTRMGDRREQPRPGEAGFALIEVMISALMIGLIIVATFNGFDVASRATASERARAQADALAQQAQDKLRGAPISALTALEVKPNVETVTQNGTVFTITSTAQYVSDSTATASCSSSATSANYLRTTSTVTWPALGSRKPIVETGIISPPPGSALIMQVTDASSLGVAGANVTATGPLPEATPHTLETASNGCAILALLPGEYKINVSKTGYVDQSWYSSSELDPNSTHSIYLTAESAAKEPFRFAPAGTLKAEFTTESAASEGDSFVAFNSLIPAPSFRQIGTVEKYSKTVTSNATVFPFEAKYTAYAGTCEANNPVDVNPKNSIPPTVTVPAGGEGKVKVIAPPINIRVMTGTKAGKATEGVKLENAVATLKEPVEPAGCNTTRKFTTTKEGALPHPGMPFGEYTLCVTGGSSGPAAKRRFTTTFENDTATGPSELAKITNGGMITESGKKIAVIYLGAGAAISPGSLGEGTECP